MEGFSVGEPHPDMIGRARTCFTGLFILGRRYTAGVRPGQFWVRKLYSSGSIRTLLLRWVRNVLTKEMTSDVVSDWIFGSICGSVMFFFYNIKI